MIIPNANVMSADDHQMVTGAVSQAEQDTDGEIVTIVAKISDDYRESTYVWASIAALLTIATFALFPDFYTLIFIWFSGQWNYQFSPSQYVFLAGSAALLKWIVVWLILHWAPLRIALTLPAVKKKAVHARAIELFRVGTERRTLGRTGILIYLSMKEHRAEIVADEAITAKVSAEVWGDAMIALTSNLHNGRPGQGMADAVRQVGTVLAQHFPKSDSDHNELPDRLIEL